MRMWRAAGIGILLLVLLSGCSLILFLSELAAGGYQTHVEIIVEDLSEDLTWDDAPADTLEYAWSVEMDTDGNNTTGSPSGTELLVQLSHVSSGASSSHGYLLDSYDRADNDGDPTGQPFTIQRYYWNDFTAKWILDDSPEWACDIEENTISLNFDHEDYMPAGFRAVFSAQYYPPPGPSTSDSVETEVVMEGATVTDAIGDAGVYSFIDIVSASITVYPTEGRGIRMIAGVLPARGKGV